MLSAFVRVRPRPNCSWLLQLLLPFSAAEPRLSCVRLDLEDDSRRWSHADVVRVSPR